MDEPPRKRRRTSSLAPASSPGDDALQRATSLSPLKKPPRRRSFASPTKASLARFNPNLLQKQSIFRDDRAQQTTARDKSAGEQGPGLSEAKRETVGGEEGGEGEAEAGAQEEGAVNENIPFGLPLPRRPKPNVSVRRSPHLPRVREEEEPDREPASSPTAMLPDERRPGVLFSSPSKRPKRPKAPAASSTLQYTRPEARKRRSPSAAAGAEAKRADGTPESQRKKQHVEPDQVLEAKKREKEALLRELHGLEDDVTKATQKLRLLQDPKTPGILNVFERDQIVSLLAKLTRPTDAPAEPEQAPISSLLNSFLPFTVSAIAPPKLVEEKEEYIPSHRPLQLDDPLPYLSLFTPFTFDSTISIPSISESADQNGDGNPLYQKHSISVTGPQKMFTAKIDMVVDTITHTVVLLSVPVLSYWAEHELGLFMRKKAEEERDLGCVTWAMGSYWLLAVKRAVCWHKCAQAYPHLVPGHKGFADEDSTSMKERVTGDMSAMSRKDMLSWLGREDLVLENQHVRLKVKWGIGFDWTGEAESSVSVEYAVPSIWSEADTSSSLKKIPETFNALLESRGVFEAVRIMVKLLFVE